MSNPLFGQRQPVGSKKTPPHRADEIINLSYENIEQGISEFGFEREKAKDNPELLRAAEEIGPLALKASDYAYWYRFADSKILAKEIYDHGFAKGIYNHSVFVAARECALDEDNVKLVLDFQTQDSFVFDVILHINQTGAGKGSRKTLATSLTQRWWKHDHANRNSPLAKFQDQAIALGFDANETTIAFAAGDPKFNIHKVHLYDQETLCQVKPRPGTLVTKKPGLWFEANGLVQTESTAVYNACKDCLAKEADFEGTFLSPFWTPSSIWKTQLMLDDLANTLLDNAALGTKAYEKIASLSNEWTTSFLESFDERPVAHQSAAS